MFVGIFKSDPKFETSLTQHDYHVTTLHHWNKTEIQHDVSDLVSTFHCIHHYSVPRYVNMFNMWHCSLLVW